MRWRNTKRGFGSPAILLHWLMLLLIVAAYAMMDLNSLTPRKSAGRESMAAWHYGLGLSVFALAWLRLLLRATGPAPETQPAPAPWEATLASAMHWVLYAFMLGMPLLGWLTLSAQGEPMRFLRAQLPALVGKSESEARLFKDIHQTLATVGYFLIGLHALAALFHHYVRRDNTLLLMWPRRRLVPARPE